MLCLQVVSMAEDSMLLAADGMCMTVNSDGDPCAAPLTLSDGMLPFAFGAYSYCKQHWRSRHEANRSDAVAAPPPRRRRLRRTYYG